MDSLSVFGFADPIPPYIKLFFFNKKKKKKNNKNILMYLRGGGSGLLPSLFKAKLRFRPILGDKTLTYYHFYRKITRLRDIKKISLIHRYC